MEIINSNSSSILAKKTTEHVIKIGEFLTLYIQE